jgi:hypothetical protein
MGSGSGDRRGEIVECDITTCFDDPPSSEWTQYPNEISSCVAGVAEKAARFASGSEFGEGVGKDASGALSAERAQM